MLQIMWYRDGNISQTISTEEQLPKEIKAFIVKEVFFFCEFNVLGKTIDKNLPCLVTAPKQRNPEQRNNSNTDTLNNQTQAQ